MAREVTPVDTAARLAKLDEMFGTEAGPYYLNTAGDWCRGTVDSVGSMQTDFGSSPYVDFQLEDGESAETQDVVKGQRYRLAFLGTVMSGRFASVGFTQGTRFIAMNRGERQNRAGTQTYKNIEIRVMAD